MDDFKLKNFERDYPNEILSFSTLNNEDTRWVLANILNLSNLPKSMDNTQLFYNSVANSLKNEILYEDEITKYFLQSVLGTLGINNDSICFILWDFENKIDLFSVNALLNQWDYIWYDTSDEALILYFPSKDKLILATDQGFVKTN